MSPERVTDRILDRIRLHRQADRHAIVLCEGSPDRAVLRELMTMERAVFAAGKRADVLALLQEVLASQLGPCAAVVDRDFDAAATDAASSGLPVVVYPCADLESMLWESAVFEAALESLSSEAKLQAFGGSARVRQVADNIALPLQRLRVVNLRCGLGLNFDDLDLRSRIKTSDLTMSVDGLCDSLRQGRTDIDRSWLIDRAHHEVLPKCPVTGANLVRGKDRLAVLGVALRRLIGNLNNHQAHYENVARPFYTSVRLERLSERRWLGELEALLR
jgi:hypothetical protein